MCVRASLAALLCGVLCATALQPGASNEHDVVHLVFSNHVVRTARSPEGDLLISARSMPEQLPTVVPPSDTHGVSEML